LPGAQQVEDIAGEPRSMAELKGDP
jgi:hypothetical protein